VETTVSIEFAAGKKNPKTSDLAMSVLQICPRLEKNEETCTVTRLRKLAQKHAKMFSKKKHAKMNEKQKEIHEENAERRLIKFVVIWTAWILMG
jgi:hypothetical protein